MERSRAIRIEAQKDVGKLSNRDLWLIGTILYWAEGSKEVEGKPASKIVRYWMGETGFPKEKIRVYYKHSTRSLGRQNTKRLYHGVLRVRVNKSSSLLRRIQGWTDEIARQLLGGGVTGNTSAFEAEDSRFEA